MNKHLLLALLFIPMVACGDANADTVGSGSDVTLKRYVIHPDDFSLNEQGGFDPILIPVPAGSQLIKADWIQDNDCPSPQIYDHTNTKAQINCDNELRVERSEGGTYSIIIAY